MEPKSMDIEEIFNTARRKPTEAERSAYLDEVCRDNPEVRGRVEKLLKAHNAAGGFLEPPVASVEVTFDDLPLTEGPGTKIGRYKLLELIGEGGFGVVYMAEQREPIRRRVALKIIKLGMDTKQVIARFEAERQALAMMEHPNIAKVLDAGATETGRPYFVMELVKGIRITEYCDKNNLNTHQRLEIFIDVCKAVQHAHQKGIIHRDIKPSNVLITLRDDGSPVPKIIDFGIAKATQKSLTEKTLFTEFHQFVGTPEYMSPEQAQMGELDVDTRSDIYSLGILLYELLTGRTPLERKELLSASYDQMIKIIREAEPPRPSSSLNTLGEALSSVAKHRQVEPGQLCKIIRGDLDWIVLKTLEKDRKRRYETANELAADIERHLGDEPVAASPPSAVYRMRKFVRRNRTAVAVVLAILAALIIGLSLATVGFVQASYQRDRAVAAEAESVRQRDSAEAQRQRAEANFKSARDAVDEITRVAHEQLAGVAGTEQVQRQLWEKAEVFYQGFLAENIYDPGALRQMGWAYMRLGVIYRLTKHWEQAGKSFRKAIDVCEKLVRDFPEEPQYRTDLAGNYFNLVWALLVMERLEEGKKACQSAIANLGKILGDFPGEPNCRWGLVQVHVKWGEMLREAGDYQGSVEHHLKGLCIAKKLVADCPEVTRYEDALAHAHTRLAHALYNMGRIEEAEAENRPAVGLLEKVAANCKDHLVKYGWPRWGHWKNLCLCYGLQARVLRDLGRDDEAEEMYRREIAAWQKLVSKFPDESDYRDSLADSYRKLGQLLSDLGRKEEAEEAYQKAEDRRQKTEDRNEF